MRYSKNWLYIDLLNFVTFLPFFFVLPLFMKFFAVAGLYFVYKKQTKALWVFGALSLLFSFYGKPFVDFRYYIEFLVSLLIWGIYLQRTQSVNFYVKYASVLFFGLSVVFFQNIYMLFYLLFEIYLFVAVIFYYQLNNVKKALKEAFWIYLFSLPLVVVLFLFFPRHHQRSFIFGFSTQVYNTGFSPYVKTGIKNITLKKVPVAEFKLSKNYKNVYLKGEILNTYVNGVWLKGRVVKDRLTKASNLEIYYLKEFPNNLKYIFAVDLPFESQYGYFDENHVLKSKKKINKTLFIQLSSAMKYTLKPVSFPYADLVYDRRYNTVAQKKAREFLKIKEPQRLKKIIEYFKSQKIIYSLNADVDSKNIVDSLFKNKKGYCVHFASAFAVFCRMSGIPSRIVSGFLAKNPINGFYRVYSSDAHVWVEVLINNTWQRVDPTMFAYKNESLKEFNSIKDSKLDYYISYVSFLIEEWVVKYNAVKQKKFIAFFEKNLFWFAISGVLFAIILLILYRRSKKGVLEGLYKKLGKRPQNETVYNFLKSFNNTRLDEINALYQKITFYKHTKEDIKRLKKLIKEFDGL